MQIDFKSDLFHPLIFIEIENVQCWISQLFISGRSSWSIFRDFDLDVSDSEVNWICHD